MGLTRDEAWARWQTVPEMWAWIQERPEPVRALVERMPPGTWWRMKGHNSGVIYTPVGYNEDGTVRVHRRDWMGLEYEVFGCHPDEFEWSPLDDQSTQNELFAAGGQE